MCFVYLSEQPTCSSVCGLAAQLSCSSVSVLSEQPSCSSVAVIQTDDDLFTNHPFVRHFELQSVAC